MKSLSTNPCGTAAILLLSLSAPVFTGCVKSKEVKQKPNILFVISDDQSFPFASAYGNRFCRTPAFDRVARDGILFTRAYVTSPGSSPSRASILTGRYPWQLEEAGTHASDFNPKYKTYPYVLEEAGYHVGGTGKGWAPGSFEGWPHNPAGKLYNDIKLTPPTDAISKIDYAANFEAFLSERAEGQPFCFWFGSQEPHRPFQQDSYLDRGRMMIEAAVPDYLPVEEVVLGDLMDYAVEIEWFDSHLGRMLAALEAAGELDNTLIVVTADNGMAFPYAKANCYEQGIHVPMAIMWANRLAGGRVSHDLVSTVDLAATFLDAAGVEPTGMMPVTGRSMMPLLEGKRNFPRNAAVFAGRERHSSSRPDNLGYPMRVAVTDTLLYIRNFHPDRWPAGDPLYIAKDGSLQPAFFDIDRSPTLNYLIENQRDAWLKSYLDLATAKRPVDELFDLRKDPFCMRNLARDPDWQQTLNEIRNMLFRALATYGDTRITTDDPEIWESYPRRYGPNREFPAAKP